MTTTTHAPRKQSKQTLIPGDKPIWRQEVKGITGLSCTDICCRTTTDNFPRKIMLVQKCAVRVWPEAPPPVPAHSKPLERTLHCEQAYPFCQQSTGDAVLTNEVTPTGGRTNKTIMSSTKPSSRRSRITLTQYKGELRVDSRLLAERLENKHKNSLALIERYLGQFKGFGVVPFQMEKPLGGRRERFVLLNEDQAFLLLALSRSTVHVIDLKAVLVLAFREARYGYACQDLQTRRQEASQDGRRLARWRYDKPNLYQHVAHLREQLKLPLDLESSQ